MIREYNPSDDIDSLTDLLHRSYAELARCGLKFSASHQSPDETRRRIERGVCFVLEDCGELVGTICIYAPHPRSRVTEYRDPRTYYFGQFCVNPEHQGKGLGKRLHQHALDFAASKGARWMALDTAAPATNLISLYRRWGYAEVGRYRWDITNYESVILRREILPAGRAAAETPSCGA